MLAHTLSEVGAPVRRCVKGVKNVSWNQFGITGFSRLGLSWTTWMEPFLIFRFWHFKTNLHLLQLFRRMLHHCFAAKLQRCFVDPENVRFGLNHGLSPYFNIWITMVLTILWLSYWTSSVLNMNCSMWEELVPLSDVMEWPVRRYSMILRLKQIQYWHFEACMQHRCVTVFLQWAKNTRNHQVH